MKRYEVANLNIIGEEPRGFSEKYWIDDGVKRLVKYNGLAAKDGDIMECLSADILNNLGIDTVNANLGYNSNEEFLKNRDITDSNCIIVDSFLTDDADVTIDLPSNQIPRVNTGDEQKNISSCFYKTFKLFDSLSNIDEISAEKMKLDYVRMILGDCIIDNEDRKLKNIEVIYNERDFSYRLAPSYDNALAFNAFNIGSNEGYCNVGNQEFPVESVMQYVIEHHPECVNDIIYNLNYLVKADLLNILKNYSSEMPADKLAFIYEYINNTNALMQDIANKETIKVRN